MRGEVVLVRHAESVRPRPGGPDEYRRPLTAAGIAQADGLVADLAWVTPALIVSSPYLRAVHTIEPFARAVGMPIRIERDLREWDSGVQPTPDYARYYAESWTNPHVARPGAESLDQLTERATAMLTSLARQHCGSTVVVGSHGTFVSRALVGFGLTTVDWMFSRSMPMPAIYRLRFDCGEVHANGPGL